MDIKTSAPIATQSGMTEDTYPMSEATSDEKLSDSLDAYEILEEKHRLSRGTTRMSTDGHVST
jgi:hypothetical protein